MKYNGSQSSTGQKTIVVQFFLELKCIYQLLKYISCYDLFCRELKWDTERSPQPVNGHAVMGAPEVPIWVLIWVHKCGITRLYCPTRCASLQRSSESGDRLRTLFSLRNLVQPLACVIFLANLEKISEEETEVHKTASCQPQLRHMLRKFSAIQ